MPIFPSYAPPGPYTQTFTDPTQVSVTGQIRPVCIIATGDEYKQILQYEMIRGSSATADNRITQEDESVQVTGTNKAFQTTYYPIVTGDGSGTTTTNAADVRAYVDGSSVPIASVDGATGTVTLASAPAVGSLVEITYYHNLLDSLTTDTVSNQATGTNVDFKVFNIPIVDGTGGAVPTADPDAVTATVDGVVATVTSVSPLAGIVTLTTAPSATSVVDISYYYNVYDNTADPLPVRHVSSVNNVGNTPGQNDYVQETDYTLIDDWIHWGAAKSVTAGTHTDGYEYFDDTQLGVYLIDDFHYMDEIGTGDGSETEFTLSFTPVNGGGLDRPTDSPSLVAVYAGTTVQNALANEVTVTKVSASTKTITLQTAPTLGQTVYASYYRNRLIDDEYTFTIVTPGAAGIGTYYITDSDSNIVPTIVETSATVADVGFDQVNYNSPLKTSIGYSIDEVITLTFTSAYNYTVTSNQALGSAGTGVLDQTYIDARTGVMWTIGESVNYNFALGDTIVITVSSVTYFTADYGNNYQLPGCTVALNELTDTAASDTCIVNTYDKAGDEPAVGDVYYVDMVYAKDASDYKAKLYTNQGDVVAEYGSATIDNKISLLSYLAFLNNASYVILRQVIKATGDTDASAATYQEALDELKKPVQGIYYPRTICVGTTNGTVQGYVKNHVLTMSSMRWRAERKAVLGFPYGNTVSQNSIIARGLRSERIQMVDTDNLVLTLTDEYGSSVEYYVDSSYFAPAYAAKENSIDWAEPMTRKEVYGFTRIEDPREEPDKDTLATNGVTVIDYDPPVFKVRHSLTTDITNAFNRQPSITNIKDRVQYVARQGLDQFIGIKFTASVPAKIAAALNLLMAAMKNDDKIIIDFIPATARVSSTDPEVCEVECSYKPVSALDYIKITFNVRFTL